MCRPRHKSARQRQRDNARGLNYQKELFRLQSSVPHREQVTGRGTAAIETPQQCELGQKNIKKDTVCDNKVCDKKSIYAVMFHQ